MIKFPPEFTAIRYPGYFWNTKDGRLYSIKISGELRPLTLSKANFFNKFTSGYKLSVKGKKRYMPLHALQNLTIRDSVIKVQ